MAKVLPTVRVGESDSAGAERRPDARAPESPETPHARFGVVVLTMGRRPEKLTLAIESLLAQRDVDLDIICVGNGWTPVGLPEQVRTLALPENLGIPAGRNAGAAEVDGDLLFFFDDDAVIPDPHFLADVARRFEEHPRLGLLMTRIDTLNGEPPPQRWIPRLRKGDARRPGPVFSICECAIAMRPEVFRATDGWPDEFFYAHEGIELAWRTWDAGYVVWYAGDMAVQHPAVDPARHDYYYRLNARNRVWLARRNLPLPLGPAYVGTWTLVQVLRSIAGGDTKSLRPWFAGWREGWSTDPGPRHTMSWRTVWEMARRGRPPII